MKQPRFWAAELITQYCTVCLDTAIASSASCASAFVSNSHGSVSVPCRSRPDTPLGDGLALDEADALGDGEPDFEGSGVADGVGEASDSEAVAPPVTQ